LFGGILRSTVGCLFFGTPFKGTNFATLAAESQEIMKMFGMNVIDGPDLLRVMQPHPHNDFLTKLRDDLDHVAGRLSPRIELCCFYELKEIDIEKTIAGLIGMVAQNLFRTFVSEVSSALR
jgi:hypothetical protein